MKLWHLSWSWGIIVVGGLALGSNRAMHSSWMRLTGGIMKAEGLDVRPFFVCLLQEKNSWINCRYVDYRSYRWNQRFSSRRTIRRLSLPHRGLNSAAGRYRMPKSSCQPPKFWTRHWLHFCGCPRPRSETGKVAPASIFPPRDLLIDRTTVDS